MAIDVYTFIAYSASMWILQGILALMIILTHGTETSTASDLNYVTPNPNAQCPGWPCQTLEYYIQFNWFDNVSNTVFRFLPGEHILTLNTTVHAWNSVNLSLIGDDTFTSTSNNTFLEPSSKIVCKGAVSFDFRYITDLLIANLVFSSCGYLKSNPYTLYFADVTNLLISGIVVENGSGYGLLALNIIGNSEIIGSTFIHNHGHNGSWGGNAYFAWYYTDFIMMGSPTTAATYTINITSCRFLFGWEHWVNSTGFTSAGLTLSLYQSTYSMHVNVHNVMFNGNIGSAGNMALNLGEFSSHNVVRLNSVYFRNGTGRDAGGGLKISPDAVTRFHPPHCHPGTPNRVYISDADFRENSAAQNGGGMAIYMGIEAICTTIEVYISRVNFSMNYAGYLGGHMYLAWNTSIMNSRLSIKSSTFELGNAEISGGAVSVQFFSFDAGNTDVQGTLMKMPVLHLLDSAFTKNSATYGGAIAIELMPGCYCNAVHVLLTNVCFHNNSAIMYGGGIHIVFGKRSYTSVIHILNGTFLDNVVVMNVSDTSGGSISIQDAFSESQVRIENSIVKGGLAHQGGGLAIVEVLDYFCSKKNQYSSGGQNITEVLYIRNTSFMENHSYQSICKGNALYISQVFYTSYKVPTLDSESCSISTTTRQSRIEDCTFTDKLTGHCSFVWILQDDKFLQLHHFLFSNTLFNGSGVSLINVRRGITFFNCEFITAVIASGTTLLFDGNNTFRDNLSNTEGGALALCSDSVMYLRPHTHVRFKNNHAKHSGGAIYIQESCSLFSGELCFYQIDAHYNTNITDLDIEIEFNNNTAGFAGSALYGGDVDHCSLYGRTENHFDVLFRGQDNDQDPTAISSNPRGVCFCADNNIDCNMSRMGLAVHPGASFSIHVVLIGQRNGTVPGEVYATFQENSSATLDKLQNSQEVHNTCTLINYTIYSSQSIEIMALTFAQSLSGTIRQTVPLLSISLLPCPLGFDLTHPPGRCDCVDKLKNENITCDINTELLSRPSPVWIGYHHSNDPSSAGVIIHDNCPFDYCKGHNFI